MARGRSIRIYLANGEVTGIRHAELANWTGQAITCPRTRLTELGEWPEAQRPGVYFLVGAEVAGEREVYVGESENVLTRLASHTRNKDFWTEVVLFTSKDAHLTKAHVKFLEHRLIELCRDVGRSVLHNGTGSLAPSLPRADGDAMDDFVDNLRVLLGALGHRFLVPLGGSPTDGEEPAEDVLSFGVGRAAARGRWTNEGLVVLRGSTASSRASASMGKGNTALRQELIAAGKLTEEGALLRFADDVLFATPSQAAVMVSGSAVNGWKAWKNAEGVDLDGLAR